MGGEEFSVNFKRRILKMIKDFTNQGKHKEANDIFKKYFGDKNDKD